MVELRRLAYEATALVLARRVRIGSVWLVGPLPTLRRAYYQGRATPLCELLEGATCEACACGALLFAWLTTSGKTAHAVGPCLTATNNSMLVRALQGAVSYTQLALIEAAFELRPPSDELGELPREVFLAALNFSQSSASDTERALRIFGNIIKNGEFMPQENNIAPHQVFDVRYLISGAWSRGILRARVFRLQYGAQPMSTDIRWFSAKYPIDATEGKNAFLTESEARAAILRHAVALRDDDALGRNKALKQIENVDRLLVHDVTNEQVALETLKPYPETP